MFTMNSRRGTAGARALAALVAVSLPFAGCEDDTSGPENGDDVGTIEAFVTDDPQSGAPAVLGEAGDVSRSMAAVASAFTGSIQGDFRAAISVDGETWVDLGSLNGISLSLQTTGGETSVHGQQSVSVGTYSRVRLVIDGAQAEIAAGSVIGTITLGVDTSVSIGSAGQVVVDVTVAPFTIESGTDARVVFDLNSEAWLTEPAVTLGTASEAEVASNVDVGVSMNPS